MKEVTPDKGLKDESPYTEAEFDAAMSGNKTRQSIEDAKSKKEKVEDLAEMPLDGDDTLREGDKFVSSEGPVEETGFSAAQAQEINTITLLRIYDMLGAILTVLDKDDEYASALLEAHASGNLVGPLPYLNIQA